MNYILITFLQMFNINCKYLYKEYYMISNEIKNNKDLYNFIKILKTKKFSGDLWFYYNPNSNSNIIYTSIYKDYLDFRFGTDDVNNYCSDKINNIKFCIRKLKELKYISEYIEKDSGTPKDGYYKYCINLIFKSEYIN